MNIVTHSVEETQKLIQDVASELFQKPGIIDKPLVLMFYGNLGVGKTACMKIIGHELGIDDLVSPAFVVYYEYRLDKGPFRNLYHFDLYRITDANEFDHLGVDELLIPGNILAIEWSEKSSPIELLLRTKSRIVEIHIDHAGGDDRSIRIVDEVSK